MSNLAVGDVDLTGATGAPRAGAPLTGAPSLAHAGTRAVPTGPVQQRFAGREVQLGATKVRRLLPNLHRRLVGGWCFVDHYGPEDITAAPGMVVPPHPHIGLQTVSWLLDGEVHHRDSLGNSQRIAPGELGLMTAGRGIAHAEHSPVPHPALLHGVQLWVALPSGADGVAPDWEHHPRLPVVDGDGFAVTVLLGTLADATSPGTTYSPLVGAEFSAGASARTEIALEADFEFAALVLLGQAKVDGVPLGVGAMLYLGTGRRRLAVSATAGARLLLLGGQPFGEDIVMWWNFVGHDAEQIAQARQDWEQGVRFGTVAGAGAPLAAPPLPEGVKLRPRGATR